MIPSDAQEARAEMPEADEPDSYVEDGCVVFTAAFHRKRGYCCGNGCRHCPYEGEEEKKPPSSLRGRG